MGLKVCNERLAIYPNSVLVGDFNFDSEHNFVPPHDPLENEALARFLPGFVDVWAALRPSERGLTFDSKTNPYIGNPEHARYDRAMVKLHDWSAASIDLIGDKPLDHLVELSAREQDWLERPPTPPRPSGRPRVDPSLAFASFDEAFAPSQRGREESPPARKKCFFVSDHFGLLLTCSIIN